MELKELKTLLKRYGFTQRDLGKLIGYSQMKVLNWLFGRFNGNAAGPCGIYVRQRGKEYGP